MNITIRAASPRDQELITAFVRSERMNPFDLDWRHFVVAFDARGLAGTVQMRDHFDGSQELGSLVVRPDMRRRGLAARLINRLMSRARGNVYMITAARFASHYSRWSFEPVEPTNAPIGILRNYFLGRVAGFVSRVTGRTPTPLAVLATAK